MGKPLFIAEKPSVANEFAKALNLNTRKYDGYLESDKGIVTWCVGHLVTMSYPEVYDIALKRWSLDTLPFIPSDYKYEVIPSVAKQFKIVSGLLNREDVDFIYVCTDSGREGEYIYRLVEQLSGVCGKKRKRVWIDSQTEDEIIRGVREAKDLSEYDNLSEAAYLRAKEDYLMGINFSRVLTLKYGSNISNYLKKDRVVISVGRVMTCVLGMVVNREREIREFVKTPFYRVLGKYKVEDFSFEGEWKVNERSLYYNSPKLYKENGFTDEAYAKELVEKVHGTIDQTEKYMTVDSIEKKKENKNAPLLYNLAELQNECSKMFKISPDETLKVVQELYEKKMVTYPRTDARVLSTAVAKEIHKNIKGITGNEILKEFANEILSKEMYKNLEKTKYVNDKQITDHYAIIPTGQGLNNLNSLGRLQSKIYEVISRRFLSIFYPPAVYQKIALSLYIDIGEKKEIFNASFKVLLEEGYQKVLYVKKKTDNEDEEEKNEDNDTTLNINTIEMLKKIKKNDKIHFEECYIKEGETSPPKRYNSGSIILAMENAGQLIEDEELRAQIKGSGIGTSATRAEILKKLIKIEYMALNKKTQIITPTQMGEMIYDVVWNSIRPLLNPELTASWEKGLTYVSEGNITSEEYMVKLNDFVTRRVNNVKMMGNQYELRKSFDLVSGSYK